MQSSITFFSLVSSLLQSANQGLNQALSLAEGQPVVFVAPKINIQIRCTVTNDGALAVSPSNATGKNLYGAAGESLLNLEFKLKPKG